MTWHYQEMGDQVHVRVTMNNGERCGVLVLSTAAFKQVQEHCPWITFQEVES